MTDVFFQRFLRRDAPAHFQFIKYAFCGGVATLVQTLVFFLLAWLVLPALKPNEFLVRLLDLQVPEIADAVRGRNAVINNGLAFILSNLTAYLMDILWVFESGRRYAVVDKLLLRQGWLQPERLRGWAHRTVEVLLFYAVSGLAVGLGTLVMWYLIRSAYSTELAFVAQIIISVAINYVLRKFLIFKG